MKKRKLYKSLLHRSKKIPFKLRVSVAIIFSLIIVSIPTVIFIKKHPKQYKPEFKTQLWGDWDYTLASPQGNLITSLGTDDNNAVMKVERNGGSVTITSPLNKANIKKEDDYVIYKTENDLINIKYQALEEGIKEEIILYDDPYQTTFVSKISLANVEPRVTSDGQIVFVNPEEEYQFHIESPFAQDATGDTTYNLKYRILEIEDDNADPEKLKEQSSSYEESYKENYLDQNGQNHVKQEVLGSIDGTQKAINTKKEYYLVLETDTEWMQDPNRQYPIIIDPTIVHDESSEFAGQFNRVTDTGSGSSPSLETYYQEVAADAHTVGLWHMNETANNSCSGGEDICDSSGNNNNANITGTASIIDGILDKGRYLDGDDTFATTSNYNFTYEDFTIEMWINPKDLSNAPILFSNGVYDGSGYYMHLAAGTNGGYVHFYTNQAGAHQVSYSYLGYSLNEWHHLAIVRTGPNVAIYCDGEDITYVTGNHIDPASTTYPFTVGTYSPAPAAYYFDGDIDEVRVSDVARTPEEIKAAAQRKPYSVYTSDVLNISGATGFNYIFWEELGVSPGDGETLYDATDLIAQWNFNETSGTAADNAAGSCGATCDGILYGMTTTGQDVVANSGWTSNNRRWGAGALMFDNVNDYVYIGNLSITDGADDLTVEAWVYSESSDANHHRLFSENGILYVGQYSDQVSIYMGDTDGSAWSHYSVGMGKLSVGQWHHIVWVKDGTSAYVYIDGVQTGTMDAPTTLGTSGGGNYLGGSGPAQMWDGTIDSVRMYSRALSADEVIANYNSSNIEFQTRTGPDSSPDDGNWSSWTPTNTETLIDNFSSAFTADSASPDFDQDSETNIIQEGSTSLKIDYGLDVDVSTRVLWHLDETNGDVTGNDIFDATTNNYDLEINGSNLATAVIEGIKGKARTFNGTNDYLTVANSPNTSITNWTLEAWIKPSNLSQASMAVYNGTDSGGYGFGISNGAGSNGGKLTGLFGYVVFMDSGYTFPNTDQWYHVAMTRDTTTTKFYVNGVQTPNTYTNTPNAVPSRFTIGNMMGADNSTPVRFFAGAIDEVRFSNTTRSAEKIGESYRLARDHYLNKTITTSDLSSKTTLPFYIAGDRPGTYLATTVGESAYANYQTDANTLGLWHLDDIKSNSVLNFTSTNVAASNAYSYYKAIDGQSTVLATGDTVEYDVFLDDNISNIGGIDMKFTDNSYARDVSGWTDDHAIGCHPGRDLTTYAYGKWYHRICNVPSGMNGKTINFVDLVNEYDSATTITAYYDNFTVKDSTGAIKTNLYTSGSTTYNTIDFEHNGSNSQSLATTTLTTPNSYYEDAPTASFIKDVSGNSYNGTPYYTGENNGKIGLARSFDGSRSYINSTSNLGNPTNITAEAWFKLDSLPTSSYGMIISQGRDYYGSGYAITVTSGGNLSFLVNTDNVDDGNEINIGTPFTDTTSWHHVAGTYDGTTAKLYLDGKLVNSVNSSGSIVYRHSETFMIGKMSYGSNYFHFNGLIDEVRISNIARSADQIRQAYEASLRSHPITIDFAASGDSGNLITNSGDYSFIIDATAYGLSNKGSNLYLGDKIIVREQYAGTNYIAQGTVTAINESTGAVTVSSWDTGSTFPSSGYTAKANFFKWQREYWDISNNILDSHLNTVTHLSIRITNGIAGHTIWIDDLRSSDDYLTNKDASTITSPLNSYIQYRAILSSSDEKVSAKLESVTLDYTTNASPSEPTSLLTENQTNPIAVLDTTPEFSAIYNDADAGDIANKYQIQVDNNSDFSSPFWDSGSAGTSMTDCSQGNRCNDISYAGSSLSAGTTYYWRIRYWDDSDDVGAWSTGTNTFSVNGAPNTPSLDSPINTVLDQSRTPSLLTTTTDPNSEYVRYKIELCEDEAMTTNCQTFDQTSSQTGWSGQNTQSNTAYTSGVQATYTLQTNLNFNTTYYWRSYAIDPSGTDTWSATQAHPYSFSTLENQTPTTPSLDSPADEAESQSIYLNLLTTSTDSDSDYIRYKIELCENETMTTNCQTYDQTATQVGWTGQDVQSGTAYASGTQATYTVHVALGSETTYYWRSYAIDPAGSNTWSTTQTTPYSFTTLPVPDAPAPCTISRNPLNNNITIQWEDNNLFKDSYTLQKKTNAGAFTNLYTSIPTSTYEYLDTSISTGNTYQYRIATIYDGISSAWCTTTELSIGLGDFYFEGINMSGLSID